MAAEKMKSFKVTQEKQGKSKSRKQQITSLLTGGFRACCLIDSTWVLFEVKASKKPAPKKILEQKSVKVKTHTSPASGRTASTIHPWFLHDLFLGGRKRLGQRVVH